MPTYIRRNVWTPAADDPISHYATAVAAMKAISAADPSDPTGWSYQAAIHGTDYRPAAPSWNQCRHGTWNFVPWHRMFVYFFEQIVRTHVVAAGGPADWALPYWDYEGPGVQPQLPLAFRNPTLSDQSPNPLYMDPRAPGLNQGAALSPLVTSAAQAMACPTYTGTTEFGGGPTPYSGQFYNQTGELEQQPHNVVHNAVGGPDGVMSDPLAAALDPIFWLHHANIDRLWWQWQQDGHANPTDNDWLSESFSFFTPDKQPAALTIRQVLDCSGQLDYTYEVTTPVTSSTPPPRVPPGGDDMTWPEPFPQGPPSSRPRRSIAADAPKPEMVGASSDPTTLTGESVTRTVAIDRRATQQVSRQLTASAPPRAYLNVDDIEADANPGTVYGVYVNLPDDPTDTDLATHQAATLSFFGVERARDPQGDEHAHGLHVSTDVTGLLDRLAAAGDWQDGGQLEVTFRPITLVAPADQPELKDQIAAPAHPDRPVSVGRVSLYIA